MTLRERLFPPNSVVFNILQYGSDNAVIKTERVLFSKVYGNRNGNLISFAFYEHAIRRSHIFAVVKKKSINKFSWARKTVFSTEISATKTTHINVPNSRCQDQHSGGCEICKAAIKAELVHVCSVFLVCSAYSLDPCNELRRDFTQWLFK